MIKCFLFKVYHDHPSRCCNPSQVLLACLLTNPRNKCCPLVSLYKKRLGSLKFLLGYWEILSKKFREGTDTIYILLPPDSSSGTFISSCWRKDRLLNHEWNIQTDLRICDSSQWFYVNVIPKPHFWRNLNQTNLYNDSILVPN